MRRRDSGFAVVLALVVAAALAFVALNLGAIGRSHAIDALATQQRLQAELASEGAIERALFALGRPEDAFEDPLSAQLRTGSGLRFEIGDATVDLAVATASGLIDLNHAPYELIGGLLEVAGLEPTAAEAFKRALLDRRDSFVADPRPLRHLTELLVMPGVDPESYRRLLPLVTLAGASSIDPTTAPELVLAAVPGMDLYAAQSLIATRLAGWATAEQLRDRAPSDARAYLRGDGDTTYVVRARARLKGGATVLLERTVAGRRYDGHLVFRSLQQWAPPVDAAWSTLDAAATSAPY